MHFSASLLKSYVIVVCIYIQLDGTLAGDEGFDPLGLSNIEELGIGMESIVICTTCDVSERLIKKVDFYIKLLILQYV